MQTHPLRVSLVQGQPEDIRAELMLFTDVLDVFATSRTDTVVVVCAGRPRPAEWVRALRAAGYTIPPRLHPRRSPDASALCASRPSSPGRRAGAPGDARFPWAGRFRSDVPAAATAGSANWVSGGGR